MTRLILTILQPILWLTKTLGSKKARFYVPLKMNDKCYCKSGVAYKNCHFKKDKERGKTAYFVIQKNKPQPSKYALFSEFKKKRLSKVYASDDRVKKTLGDVDYGALYLNGSYTPERVSPNTKFETDYDVAFDEGAIDAD